MKIHIDTIRVQEHRAPTDESVKLLKEMEEAAKAKVDQALRIESLDFDCIVQIHREFSADTVILVAKYRLGSKSLEAQVAWPTDKFNEDLPGFIDTLIEVMAAQIAREILKPAMMRVACKLGKPK